MKTTLGGKRLGNENIMPEIDIHEPGTSHHDLGRVNRLSCTVGPLYPVMIEKVTAGDEIPIYTEGRIKTVPLEGPMFGSFKTQTDFFFIPLRLYNKHLHNDKLNIDPSEIAYPQMTLEGPSGFDGTGTQTRIGNDLLRAQVNAGSLIHHLGISGLGTGVKEQTRVSRNFNAIGMLGYYDIYKNFYANTQEYNAHVIGSKTGDIGTTGPTDMTIVIPVDGEADTSYQYVFREGTWRLNTSRDTPLPDNYTLDFPEFATVFIRGTNLSTETIKITNFNGNVGEKHEISEVAYISSNTAQNLTFRAAIDFRGFISVDTDTQIVIPTMDIKNFPLKNLDDIRSQILASTEAGGSITLTKESIAPFNIAIEQVSQPMAGLALKTHLSDRFNAWLNTTTVNNIINNTRVAVTNGAFTIDALRLANKVNEMMQRTLVMGGKWTDWLRSQYGDAVRLACEIPQWIGSKSGEIVFEDVVSTSETGSQPLGHLAGRGKSEWKSGKIFWKAEEPGIIMGIFSITPRVDYSTGNRAYTRYTTLNDDHIPALDAIGFQDLVTDEFATFDTIIDANGEVQYKSVGKQPAWTEYMTATNETHGHFAANEQYSFMALNRVYRANIDDGHTLDDGTTYIDPRQYNQVFADTSITAQNIWVQIAFDIRMKRKMSKKVMPKL